MMAAKEEIEYRLRLSNFTIEQASDAVFWVDAAARIHRVNKAACRLYGYSREELLTMTVLDIAPDSKVDMWREQWAKMKACKTLTHDSHHRAKDGRLLQECMT